MSRKNRERNKLPSEVKRPLPSHPLQDRERSVRIFGRSVPKLFLWLFFGTFLCVVILVSSGVAVPSPVRGKLTKFGEISLNYNTSQASGISPLCGCAAELEAEKWRGITFFGRGIHLRRSGGCAFTNYLLSGAYPAQIVWNPPNYADSFLAEGTVWVFSIPDDVQFDPQALKTTVPSNYRVIRRVEFDGEKYFSFVTRDGINIRLLGQTPLIAWIPAKGSDVSIKTKKGMFPASPTSLELVEHYHRWDRDPSDDADKGHKQEHVDYPLGDFLGPDVVIWTEDPNAFVTASKNIWFSGLEQENHRVVIAALISRPPWSVRISCIPVDEAWIDKYSEVLPHLGGRVISRKLDQAGQVELTLDSVANSDEFQNAYRLMTEHQFVWVNDLGGEVKDRGVNFGQRFNFEFRYPPIPAKDGINIFGPVHSLRFSAAEGRLLARNQRVDIDVNSYVGFEGMRGLTFEGGLISIPVKTDSASADFHVRSVKRLEVNGETENTVRKLLGMSTAAEQVIIFAALVQAVCAVLALRRK